MLSSLLFTAAPLLFPELVLECQPPFEPVKTETGGNKLATQKTVFLETVDITKTASHALARHPALTHLSLHLSHWRPGLHHSLQHLSLHLKVQLSPSLIQCHVQRVLLGPSLHCVQSMRVWLSPSLVQCHIQRFRLRLSLIQGLIWKFRSSPVLEESAQSEFPIPKVSCHLLFWSVAEPPGSCHRH